MFLSIGHLTGSTKVTKNHFNSDEVIFRKRRTVQQMFFQPYESKQEFIYCARHTFLPMAVLGLASGSLIGLALAQGVIIVGGIAAIFEGMSGVSKYNASFLGAAINFIKDLCQALLDLVVLPLSALVMLTRGISTGLHTTGICREYEEMPSPSL